MVFFAEQFANIDIGSIRQLPAQIHDNLTRLNEFGVPFFGSNIFRTNAEVFRNDFYNQFRVISFGLSGFIMSLRHLLPVPL